MQGAIELRLQQPRESRQRFGHSRVHRSQRDFERLGDLTELQALVMPQHQHRPIDFRQLAQGGADQFALFAFDCSQIRGRLWRRALIQRIRAFVWLDLTPKGRKKGDGGESWLKLHDEYETGDKHL